MRADFSRYNSYPDNFYEEQNDLLAGTMLGDGCILHGGKGRYTCFSFEQTISRKEYIDHIFMRLMPFTDRTSVKSVRCDKTKYGKGVYTILKFRTMCHPLFSVMRKDWYEEPEQINSCKVVPKNISLNWRAISYWFADDGHRRLGPKREIVLCSESFSRDDNEFLSSKLFELGIDSTISKKNRIRIRSHNYFDFIDAITPHLIDIQCMNYKINVSGITRAVVPSYSYDVRNNVLKMWKTGEYTQAQLAKMTGCHKRTIYRWIKDNKNETIV